MTDNGIGKTTRHDALTCPSCGHEGLDAATKMLDDGAGGGPGPAPGSYTVCAECGEFLRFSEGLVLEKCEIPADMSAKQKRTVAAAQAFFRARGGHKK